MHKVHYSTKSLVGTPLAGVLFTLGAGWFWWSGGGAFALILLLVFGILTAIAISNAISGEPAITFDRQGLVVRAAGRRHPLEWSDVHSISVETLTLRYYGFIPISRTTSLVIKVDGGLIGAKRLRLNADSLALPPGGLAVLVAMLQQAHVSAVGVAGVAMKGASQIGWGVKQSRRPTPSAEPEQGSGFDPDAALARYLQRREQGEDAPPSSAPETVRTFGRAPAPQPAAPAPAPRAGFGRRGL